MSENKNVGTFCWIELATNHPKEAVNFYKALFPWEVETDNSAEMEYTLLRAGETYVAGCYELLKIQKDQNIPPHWMPYACVEDIDESLEKVESLGGKVILPKKIVKDIGEMAVIQDTTGAVVSLWKCYTPMGNSMGEAPGLVNWVELGTRQPEKAKDFYTRLFDWTACTEKYPGMEYTVFSHNNKCVAGLFHMPKEMEEIPSHWLTYFSVENCEKSVEIVEKNGGKIIKEVALVPNMGHFSVVQDPRGAPFALMDAIK